MELIEFRCYFRQKKLLTSVVSETEVKTEKIVIEEYDNLPWLKSEFPWTFPQILATYLSCKSLRHFG